MSNDYKDKGNSFYNEGNYDQACICYTKAIEYDKTNSIAYCNRAAAYLMLGENEKASKDCLTAIDIDPEYIRSYLRCGRSFLNQGYGNKAKSYYSKCLELCENKESNNENIKNWRIECEEGIKDCFTIQKTLKNARELIDSHKPQLALKDIEIALEICPNARDPNLMRLEALIADENYKLSLQYLKNLVPNAFKNYGIIILILIL